MAGGAVEEVVKPGRGFSLSLTGAGLMLKPLDHGDDDDVEEDDVDDYHVYVGKC